MGLILVQIELKGETSALEEISVESCTMQDGVKDDSKEKQSRICSLVVR